MQKMLPRSSIESLGAACAAIAMGACLVAFGSPACSPACNTTDAANPAERYDGGAVTGGQNRYYVSSDWNAGLLHFPGGKRYELVHHLGFTPAEVSVYVSFAGNNEPLTLCAGNTCVIQAVKDDAIIIKNDTCSEFWVRVVASGVSPTSGDAGATADSGATD
jgi:hypothetical protein